MPPKRNYRWSHRGEDISDDSSGSEYRPGVPRERRRRKSSSGGRPTKHDQLMTELKELRKLINEQNDMLKQLLATQNDKTHNPAGQPITEKLQQQPQRTEYNLNETQKPKAESTQVEPSNKIVIPDLNE